MAEQHPDLEAALAAALERAKSAWPDVEVDEARFAASLRARVGANRDGQTGAVAALEALSVGDLYLAFGCAERDSAALSHVERSCMPAVRAMLGRLRFSPAQIDEAVQSMREDLLVATPDRPAGIAQFSGRGPLRSWMRVVAAHLAARLARRPLDEHVALDDAFDVADVGRDPELELLRRTYGAAFHAAIREALQLLPVRDRLLLKQRYRLGLELTELGALYQVHGSTVSRWVTRAREQLVQATRDLMMKQLGLSASEVQSVLRLVESSLDMTLSTLDERAS